MRYQRSSQDLGPFDPKAYSRNMEVARIAEAYSGVPEQLIAFPTPLRRMSISVMLVEDIAAD